MYKSAVIMSIFFITLQSVYIPSFGAILTYLGSILLVAITFFKYKLQKQETILTIILLVMLIIAGHFLIINDVAGVDFKSYIATSIMIFSYPFIFQFIKKESNNLVSSFEFVISVHAFVIFVQVIYFLIFKDYLDIFEHLFDEKSGSLGKKSLILFGERVPRFSGLFNEPGTYSVVIMSLAISYYSIVKRLNLFLAFAISSTLMTMSGFGFLLVTSLLGITFFTSVGGRFKLLFYAGIIIIGFSLVGGYSAIESRFLGQNEYSGLGFRAEMLDYYFSNQKVFFIGDSIDSIPGHFVPNDLGIWYALVLKYGIVGWAIMATLAIHNFYYTKKFSNVILIALIFLTKIKLTYPLLWLLLAIINNDKKK